MKSEIINRIASLRNFMRKHKLSAFIIPSTDPHSGEYIPKHWEARKWISGFTGSAGTVVVTLDKAGLWTDSRYFLQGTITGNSFLCRVVGLCIECRRQCGYRRLGEQLSRNKQLTERIRKKTDTLNPCSRSIQ